MRTPLAFDEHIQKARSTRPADPQQTAAAALARIQNTGGSAPNRSKNAIRQQAQRELEREATTSRDKDSLAAIKRADIDERDIEAAPVLTHILFTCALLGEDLAMSKDEVRARATVANALLCRCTMCLTSCCVINCTATRVSQHPCS
jgi:hypothetical protein